MKFSWKLLNNFIELENIEQNFFTEQLTLAGIEIENIEKNHHNDNIIDLSITTNRKEINCIFSLAREIAIILDQPLKIFPIIQHTNINNLIYYDNQRVSLPENISQINICIVKNIKFNRTPNWLNRYLTTQDIQPINLIYNIQQYLKLKWGQIFYYTEIKTMFNQALKENEKKLFNIIYTFLNNHYSSLNNYQILIFVKDNQTTTFCNYRHQEYYINFFTESIRLISTFTKCTIGKYYHIYNLNLNNNRNKFIEVTKHEINTTLGYINYTKYRYLSTAHIMDILDKLDFSPKYNKNLKIFTIQVPKYRIHDIQRSIDIIEEIGRIYQFNLFKQNILELTHKPSINNNTKIIQKIRYILRNIGLNEVINCSLTKSNLNKKNYSNVLIYNPLNQEQKQLRTNISEHLLNNYQYNIKNGNDQVEIFEISKVFDKIQTNQYKEEIYLGCLFNNPNFIHNEWSEMPKNINLFHIKGITEIFLEQINANIKLQTISQQDNTDKIRNVLRLLNPIKKIGIYNISNEQLIGIIGEVKKIYTINKNQTYLIEINLNDLVKTVKTKKHLQYINQIYSNYPYVTRDISITITKEKNINEIKETILKNNLDLIESIKVFNEYKEIKSNLRSISLRIIYRSYNRTLNNKDIEKIDKHIEQIKYSF
uniref:phenylalanine--tRNA ligase n=1 Tax=Lophocladia kuetzingii TaxID=675577 RepID=A0A1Z1MPI0_9FLOR|nr:Phenylalanine-tRNA ligase beta subunit [Lophocladia kuetzingii]ARW67752.1 Phenylalanine-tRNA ligase beta subunit [Lophocladia kuetzingii]